MIFIQFCIIIETSAEVRRYKENNRVKLDYEEPVFNDVAHAFNALTFAWFTQFIYGCQHFVIADTIVQWYFTPDKEKLRNPILTSFKNLVRYHLGSICFGASLITIVKVVRTIVEMIRVRF
jgi:solute carrier family 44 protein 1 (choline transporter-like protein)